MTPATDVKFTINLSNSELEESELEQITRNILREIRELDEVEEVDLVKVQEAPENSKALGGYILGFIQAHVTVSQTQQFLKFIHDRISNKPIEIEVESNGRKLKITATNQQDFLVAMQKAQEFVNS